MSLNEYLRSYGRDDFMGEFNEAYIWAPNQWFGAHPDAASTRADKSTGKVEYDVSIELDR